MFSDKKDAFLFFCTLQNPVSGLNISRLFTHSLMSFDFIMLPRLRLQQTKRFFHNHENKFPPTTKNQVNDLFVG